MAATPPAPAPTPVAPSRVMQSSPARINAAPTLDTRAVAENFAVTVPTPIIDEDLLAQATSDESSEQIGAEQGAPVESDKTVSATRPVRIESRSLQTERGGTLAPLATIETVIPEVSTPELATAAVKPVTVAPAPTLRPVEPRPAPKIDTQISTAQTELADVPQQIEIKQARVQIKPELAVKLEQPQVTAVSNPALAAAPERVVRAPTLPAATVRATVERPSVPASAELSAPDLSQINASADAAEAAENAAAQAATALDSTTPSRNTTTVNADALPNDAFTNGSRSADSLGNSPGDWTSQSQSAAGEIAAQDAGSSRGRGNAFRQYNDPFADDTPSRLRKLRLRDPIAFADVARYMVQKFGRAALGAALGANEEIYDRAGVDPGPLIERWLEQHHGDLKKECKQGNQELPPALREIVCN
jgi:hypothetical protein